MNIPLAHVAMSARGSFSYETTTVDGFNMTLAGAPLQVRIQGLTPAVARIYVCDAIGNKLAMPVGAAGLTLLEAGGGYIAPHNDEFLITWADSYILKVAGTDSLWVTNQKQQSFQAISGITHFTI